VNDPAGALVQAELRAAGIKIQHYFHMRNLTCPGGEHKCGCGQDPECCLVEGQCLRKYRCCNRIENVGVITNQSITYFSEDGFFADNGAFGNHTYEQEMHVLTQRGSIKPRPVLVNGGMSDEWALQHGMSIASEYTGVCHKLPKFAPKYSRDRFVAIVHTVYNATDMRRQVDNCVKIGFGNLGVVSDYNEAIPSYWEEQVAYIAAKNKESFQRQHAVAPRGAVPDLPSWAGPRPDKSKGPAHGLPTIRGAQTSTVYVGGHARGTYSHGPIITWWAGHYHINWYNAPRDEGVEMRVLMSTSADGKIWFRALAICTTPRFTVASAPGLTCSLNASMVPARARPTVLFSNITKAGSTYGTQNEAYCQHGGRLYGVAGAYDYCSTARSSSVWNAACVGSIPAPHYEGPYALLMRRILSPTLLGEIFWLQPVDGPPAGYERWGFRGFLQMAEPVRSDAAFHLASLVNTSVRASQPLLSSSFACHLKQLTRLRRCDSVDAGERHRCHCGAAVPSDLSGRTQSVPPAREQREAPAPHSLLEARVARFPVDEQLHLAHGPAGGERADGGRRGRSHGADGLVCGRHRRQHATAGRRSWQPWRLSCGDER
jgi:hypothetical protein